MKILITGAAGFIGANLSKRLVEIEPEVDIVGIDSMNDYYDPGIKEYRLREIESALSRHPGATWRFVRGSIADRSLVDGLFREFRPEIVVNLAAQAGVRYSIINPDAYVETNLIGF